MPVTQTAARAVLTSLSADALRVLATACQVGEVARATALPVLPELDALVAPKARGSRWIVATDLGLETVLAAL